MQPANSQPESRGYEQLSHDKTTLARESGLRGSVRAWKISSPRGLRNLLRRIHQFHDFQPITNTGVTAGQLQFSVLSNNSGSTKVPQRGSQPPLVQPHSTRCGVFAANTPESVDSRIDFVL